MPKSDPGVVMVRPFGLDDLEAAADFCDRARALDPAIEPFAQRLALLATGPRAMLPLWQVAQGEDGLIHGIAFAALREQRDSAQAGLAKRSESEVAEEKRAAPPALSRPPRQPYSAAPDLGAFAGAGGGARAGKPPPVLPLAPERPMPKTLQPKKRETAREAPREPAIPPPPPASELPSLRAPAPRDAGLTGSRESVNARAAPLPPVKPQRTTLEIYAAVDPALRRQGLGRALVEPLLQWVQSAGEPAALRARVNDSPGAQAGAAFLQALGFEEAPAQLSLGWSGGVLSAPELPALTLKPLRAGDSGGLDQLARLSTNAWAGAPDNFATRADELAQLMSELGRVVMLAYAGGKAIGYLSGLWLGKTLGIEEVAVLPEYRRAGVGRALVAQALRGQAKGAILSVSEENRPARAMYRALGFQQTARKRIFLLRN